MQAIVLAGGRPEGLPVGSKADWMIGGRTMADHVVHALRRVPDVTKIAVPRGDGTLVENLLAALEGLTVRDDEYVLISSCDIPFLTTEAVRDFLAGCEPGSDFYYPVVSRDVCEERFPGVKRTCVKLREGTFTGGNLFLIKAGKLPALSSLLGRLYEKRKSPAALAAELGYGMVVRLVCSSLFGTLRIAELELAAERLTGLKVKAVISRYAEIGTDIDKVEDLTLLSNGNVLHHLS